MASLKSFLTGKKYTSIPLQISKTNHLELNATINGISGLFILDTGASNTCIGIDKIAYFDLNFENSEIKAAGAGSTEMETLISTNNTIRLGNWKKKRQKIVLFDLIHVNTALTQPDANPVDGIIGADLLKKGRAVIDYTKLKLYLRS